MTNKRSQASHSRSLILQPKDSIIGNADDTLSKSNKSISDSDLITKGIKFTYRQDALPRSVAIISSTCLPVAASDQCPSTFIRSILKESEREEAENPITQPLHLSEFTQPTQRQIEAYSNSADALDAIRSCDVDKLRQLLACGIPLEACNRFGESLLHMACRRSNAKVVSFLLHEANVSPKIRDDYGRTPLHDACWRGNPEYDIVEMILRVEPRLAFVEDVRGHAPFRYARKEHWPAWNEFLDSKKDVMFCKRAAT